MPSTEDSTSSGLGDEEECEILQEPLDVQPLQAIPLPCGFSEQHRAPAPVRLPTEARSVPTHVRHSHGKLQYENTMELEDSEGEKFLAQIDHDMIPWLGKDLFIKILCTYPVG
jgi:hypothetical protein